MKEKYNSNIIKNALTFLCIFLICLLPDIYYFVAHDFDWIYLFCGLVVLAPIALFLTFLPTVIVQIPLIFCILIVSMIEVLSVYTYYNYTNAISISALIYSNQMETNDMLNYILDNIIIHEIPLLILFIISVSLIIINRAYNNRHIKRNIAFCGAAFFISLISILCFRVDTFAHSPIHFINELYTANKMLAEKKIFLSHAVSIPSGVNYNGSCENQICVLAIGESLNYSHCSFNNTYTRQTTPQLTTQSNLISYTNYYAGATYTQQSLPLIMTIATPDTYKTCYQTPPILSYFKAADYQTYVISNQSQIMNNGIDNFLTIGADSIVFVEKDRDVVEMFGHIVQRTDSKLMIILHFLGNHFFYNNYPEEYNVWSPNYTYNKDTKSDSLFINAYDNSILYTDSIIATCVNILDKQNRQSTFVFTSDHGEYLDAHVGGHGLSCHPTKDEYHVPLLVWYSEQYGQTYPTKIDNLIKHKDEPVSADHVFWSVLDMADIRINSNMQQQDMSVFGDTLQTYQRTLLLPDCKQIIAVE